MIPNRREGLYTVQTGTHRAMGSPGLAVRFEHGQPVEWTLESDRLAGHPAWTSADLRVVARIIFEDDSARVERLCAHAYLASGDTCGPCGRRV